MPVTSGGGRPTSYKLASGKRVKGVTTILGKFKDSGGLIHWAWEQGRDGRDYRESRDQAADAGHLAHAWIDDRIHGRELRAAAGYTLEQISAAVQCLGAFDRWAGSSKLTIVDTERPLVSELHAYGGTYDALATIDGQLVLLDWKTGNRLYTEHVAQLAAYRQLIRETTKQQVQGARCLRFGKELADFHDHSLPSEALDLGWKRFLAAMWMHETDDALKKVVA